MRKNLEDYVGKTLEHKAFGKCVVLRILSHKDYHVEVKVTESQDIKTLVLSSRYFKNVTIGPETSKKKRTGLFVGENPRTHELFHNDIEEFDASVDIGYQKDVLKETNYYDDYDFED